jgi:transposase
MLLRHYLEQSWTKTAIAEHLGITTRTIERWIAAGDLDRDLDAEPVRYGPRPPIPTKLDRYKPIIEARLEKYPALSAVRLFAECQADGYTGSLTQLKVFVRRVRPRPVEAPIVRFATAPGHQAQVDFAELKLPWGKRYALVVVLGYSRLLWVRFVVRQDMRTLIRGLEAAFTYFGGVPRELLFDQMRAVITRDERLTGGPLVHNLEFLRFAAHWGFVSRACRPYRAQTKGKVERPIRYLRESFLYGREFLGDGQLAEEGMRWLEGVANARVHGTTHAVPRERFEHEERAVLQALARHPYHSLTLRACATGDRRAAPSHTPSLPRIDVEQRPLHAYAALAGGAR